MSTSPTTLSAPRAQAAIIDSQGGLSRYGLQLFTGFYNAILQAVNQGEGQGELLSLLSDFPAAASSSSQPDNDSTAAPAALFSLFEAVAPSQPAILDVQLTVAGPTTIHAPATTANLLIIFIRQDGTGGRAITWGGEFEYMPDAAIALGNATANTQCAFLCALSNGFWKLVAEGPKDMNP